MTAEEMVLTLRICANDPRTDGQSCGDCPYVSRCKENTGSAELMRMAADMIEALSARAES